MFRVATAAHRQRCLGEVDAGLYTNKVYPVFACCAIVSVR